MQCRQWIFDMDGTLTDSMTVVWRGAPQALLAKYGRTPEPGIAETLLTLGMDESRRYLIQHYDLPLDEITYDAALLEVINALYDTVTFKPGAKELLEKLHAEGARMCICSNTWEAQCRRALTRLGVADWFEFFVTAQGVLSKRYAPVFFESMERLGGADPARCVVCEDSLYAARTAHEAGFRVLGIADAASRADESALRTNCEQFVTDWNQLDWANL